ncbi:MAG: hypothetical protein A3B03_02460 [Candidatus Zambryskibacteria bacterium RIFCSPLOWO2_01_FULL_42_41]|nr:MAG: hypothetical protein A2829_03330 [Candidatus Zambryskibacteria bacterium RIFCSPHIGHO2_01_FULL_43_60]OHB03420.1 MAG: hypothetical protein A3B03_02460 [Candidatus Zambryskibacteria bacterium RIFCSPLOWO2_01_FULL_42_41]
MNERTPNPKHESPEIDLSPERREDQPEPTPESVEAQKELERARGVLHDSFNTLLRSAMGGTYAHGGEEGFSGDAASLYVLTSIKNKKGEEVPELVKVGWGEFSKETFEGDQYPTFHNLPFDVYCVSQSNSYFADEKLRKEMTENPAKYLKEHSLFVASKGKVKLSEKVDGDWRNRRLDKDIQATPYDEMLRTSRNQIIRERSTPEEFAAFLRELPDDPAELGSYMSDLEHRVDWMGDRELQTADEKTRADVRKKHLMHYIWGMGVERVGIAVGDKKAMESVLALKKTFDFETNSFS